MPMETQMFGQIADAYEQMAEKVRYRPAAPSDGFGNITVPESKLDLAREQVGFAESWWEQENSCSYFIGCPHGPYRKAMIWAIEAARAMCGGPEARRMTLRLLKMAEREVRSLNEDGR